MKTRLFITILVSLLASCGEPSDGRTGRGVSNEAQSTWKRVSSAAEAVTKAATAASKARESVGDAVDQTKTSTSRTAALLKDGAEDFASGASETAVEAARITENTVRDGMRTGADYADYAVTEGRQAAAAAEAAVQSAGQEVGKLADEAGADLQQVFRRKK